MPSSPSNRKKATVAFVIPWFGDEARGGAELQGSETARAMAERGYQIEILTTCSRSFLHSWDKDHYRPGEYNWKDLIVRRFSVDRRDERLFGRINEALLSGLTISSEEESHFVGHNINSRDLYRFIAERGDEYVFVFLPYLYGTTLQGATVRPDRSILMPCFHVEPYAYLKVVEDIFQAVKGFIYLTPEEEAAVHRVVPGGAPGKVVGGGINTEHRGREKKFRERTGISEPYLLYVGRIDRGKNTHLLLSFFQYWREKGGSDLKLVLVGAGDERLIPKEVASIIHLGVADEEQKMDACAGAMALCQPSVNESFSRVIMESWLHEVPVIVHGDCQVTVGHCRRSGGGLYFREYFDFAEVLDLFLSDDRLRGDMGSAGRRYVLENYNWDRVVERLVEWINKTTGLELKCRSTTKKA